MSREINGRPGSPSEAFGFVLPGDLPVGFIMVGADDVVLEWNDVAAELLLTPVAGAVGTRFADLAVSYTVRGLRTAIEHVKATGAPRVLDDVVVGSGDGERHARISVRRGPPRQRARAVMVYVVDTTSVVRLQRDVERLLTEHSLEMEDALRAREALEVTVEELSTTLAELEVANETLATADLDKDQLIAALAHELRNPVDAAVSALEVIDSPAADRAQDEAARVMRRELHHVKRLLDDLLDVVRFSHGDLEIVKRPIDLVALVSASVEAIRPETDRAGLRLSLVLPAPGSVHVEADGERLTQVVTNLLSNAVKYTAAGGSITVVLSSAGTSAWLSVQDTGRGIAADRIESVFELFEKGRRADAGRNAGLGLGLTVSRRIVELHGGTLTALSDGVDRGSRFTVRVPRTASASELVMRAAPALGPRRILLVEDDADVREMLGVTLSLLGGHDVDVAATGVRAVEIAIATRPEVALVDMGLPDLDGCEVARRIRAALGDSVALVALTDYGQAEDHGRAREAGFVAHLVKPATYEVIAETIAQLTTARASAEP